MVLFRSTHYRNNWFTGHDIEYKGLVRDIRLIGFGNSPTGRDKLYIDTRDAD